MVNTPIQVLESDPEETQEPTPPPDYKAELEARTQELEQVKEDKVKLEHNLKSAQGALKRPLDLETELGRMRKETGRLGELVRLSLKGQAGVDTEELAKETQATQARHQAEDTREAASQQVSEVWDDIGEEIADAYGLDIDTEEGSAEVHRLIDEAPELAGVRAPASQGYASGNMNQMRQALRVAKDLRRQAQLKRQEEGIKAATQEAETKAKTDSLDLDAGDDAGGAGMTDAKFLEEFANNPGKYSSPADHARNSKILDGM